MGHFQMDCLAQSYFVASPCLAPQQGCAMPSCMCVFVRCSCDVCACIALARCIHVSRWSGFRGTLNPQTCKPNSGAGSGTTCLCARLRACVCPPDFVAHILSSSCAVAGFIFASDIACSSLIEYLVVLPKTRPGIGDRAQERPATSKESGRKDARQPPRGGYFSPRETRAGYCSG